MSLENLSLEQKRELLKVLHEKEQVEKARRIEKYKPHNAVWRGKPNDGQEAFHRSDSRIRLLVGGNQPLDLDTQVLMSDLSIKALRDIVAGDKVVAEDGTATVVNYIVRPGFIECFRINLSNGDSVVATANHCFKTKYGKMSVKEISKSKSCVMEFTPPLEGELGFTPISGMLLGLFLGDGCSQMVKGGHRASFTNKNERLHEIFKAEIETIGDKVTRYKSNPTQAYVTKGIMSRYATNFSKALESLGLKNKKAHEKFIPEMYFKASLRTRKNLVSGLILTDGCLDGHKTTFYTSSIQLANGYRRLLTSLGIRSSMNRRVRKQSCLFHQPQYYVNCSSIDLKEAGVELLHKTSKVSRRRSAGLSVISVENVGLKNVGCINISHKSHMFVLANGLITSNSGKSVGGVVEGVWLALGIHPWKKMKVPNKGRIVCSLGFEEGANQVIVPKLLEWLPQHCIASVKRNQVGVPNYFELTNGSVINILSGEQDDKVFEGWTGHWVHVDEPCRKAIYEASRRGVIKNNGYLWMTLTPLSEPWIYNDLWLPSLGGEREDVSCFTIDIYDNCIDNGGYLPREAIEAFERDLDDDVRETRMHGTFRHLSGRIYPMFDPKIHVIKSFKIPRTWHVWDGIDPHLQKEHAYCQWAITPEDEYIVCNEIWAKDTIPQLGSKIIEMRKGMNLYNTLIDTSSEAPDAIYRKTPRSMLAEMGIRTRLAQKRGAVEAGIHIMRSLLTPRECSTGEMRPRFFVMEHCKRHIKEFLNYVQDDRSTEYLTKDKPRKTWDDMMDLDRYFVVENAKYEQTNKPIRYSNARYGGAYA